MKETRSEVSRTIDRTCRDAVGLYRVESFDNIDIDALLAEPVIELGPAEWIGRHLLRHARSLDAYRTGQRILALLRSADVA